MENPYDILFSMEHQYDRLFSSIPYDCDRTHIRCNTFNKSIQLFHQKGGMVDNVFVTKLSKFMRRWGCKLEEFLKIFDYLTPTETSIIDIYSVCSIEECFEIISRILNHNPIGITLDMVKSLHEMKKVCLKYNYILMQCFTLIKPTKESIQLFTIHNNWEMVEFIYNQNKTLFDTTILGHILINNLDIAKQWIEKTGILPDSNCLEMVCVAGKIDLIEYIISFRVHPTKECIKFVIKNGPRMIYNKSKKKCVYSSCGTSFTVEQVNNIINRMVEEGYKISLEDVEFALERGIKIDRLDQYGIPMDEKLLRICYKHSTFPYDINVAPDINCLREICRKGNNVPEIKKALKENVNIKPDYQCLFNACSIGKNNNVVVKYLIDKHGIEPDIECVQQCLKYIQHNDTALILLENMKSVQNTQIMKPVIVQLDDDNDDILFSTPEKHMDELITTEEESPYEELVPDDSEEFVNK